MKKKITILFLTILIISSMNKTYAASLRGKFSESSVAGTNFREITFTPYYSNKDNIEEDTYYIYLPSGYFVEGNSATYVADKNGRYPFTVYDGSNKKTFTYKVDNIEKAVEENKDGVFANYQLMYDYEKKQVFFNLETDKQRTIGTPGGTSITNEINYYIGNLVNNLAYDFSIRVDEVPFNYKIVKSGEYYLLIYISPVNYNDYSTVVEYYGYNFTNNSSYTTEPAKDIYDDDKVNYTVLVKSNNNQHIFNINITGIDYRRPSVEAELSDDDNIILKIEDDCELDYIITYDGKYVDISGKKTEYKHPEEIIYNGEYLFTIVDKMGNKTVENVEINLKSKRSIRTSKTRHAIELDVHDFKYTEELFENKGLKFTKSNNDIKLFENILPAYMNGKDDKHFSPDSLITRAEMVTIFCRLNDLPYDNSAHLKAKFTDINFHWAKDYISMGSNKRYVSGYRDKTFKPDNVITRAEFCSMLNKISAYKSLLNAIPASSNNNYIDIDNHWAEKDITRIASRNLVISSSSEYFHPDKPITRSEVVHAINNLYGFNPSYLELAYINSLYNKYYNFQDIDKHKDYYHIIISVVGMYREIIEWEGSRKMVLNYMEEIVSRYLERILKGSEYASVCKCEHCKDDIMAMALNNLQPFYITTKRGEVFAEYSSYEVQHQTEVIKEVIHAVDFVSIHPNH